MMFLMAWAVELTIMMKESMVNCAAIILDFNKHRFLFYRRSP